MALKAVLRGADSVPTWCPAGFRYGRPWMNCHRGIHIRKEVVSAAAIVGATVTGVGIVEEKDLGTLIQHHSAWCGTFVRGAFMFVVLWCDRAQRQMHISTTLWVQVADVLACAV